MKSFALTVATILLISIYSTVNCDETKTTSAAEVPEDSPTTTGTTEMPLKRPDCYWTECQSPLTYNLKCPLGTQEQNQNDDTPCPGIFVRYQCCPVTDDASTTSTQSPAVPEFDVKPEAV